MISGYLARKSGEAQGMCRTVEIFLAERSLYDALEAEGLSVELVGGAFEAVELDAKTAINQATQLAAAV